MTGQHERPTSLRRRSRSILPDLLPLIIFALVGGVIGYLLGITAQAAEEPSRARVVEAGPLREIVVPPEEPEEPEEDEPVELVSLGEFTFTAYCPCAKCCGRWADGITATGTTATEGRTIAVDPEVIALGDTVYFEGLDGLVGGYVAEDTGGSIRGNRIDVFFEDHQEALEFGVRAMEVWTVGD